MSISKVALAGATGNLGSVVLTELINVGFSVTVLTRDISKHSFPASVTPIAVDYESLDSLTNALRGQDALVSTLASAAVKSQVLLVEAAKNANISRFIPSEFGSNTGNELVRKLPVYTAKIQVQDALIKASESSSLSYSFLITGLFLDFGIKTGSLIDLKNKSVNYYNGGDGLFSTSTLSDVAKGITGILKHPNETKNRFVYIHSAATTSKKLAEFGKKAVGADGWTEQAVSTDDLYKEGIEELKKENPDPRIFVRNLIRTTVWDKAYGGHYEKVDNDLLGVPVLTDAELEGLVASLAKETVKL